MMIAAGVNARALSTYMVDANIAITIDPIATSCRQPTGSRGLLDTSLDAAVASAAPPHERSIRRDS
jgi:hypothetical protein